MLFFHEYLINLSFYLQNDEITDFSCDEMWKYCFPQREKKKSQGFDDKKGIKA